MDPISASGTIEYTAADASEGSQVVLGSVTYTLTASPVSPTDIGIEAGNPAATMQGLVDTVNDSHEDIEASHDAVNRIATFSARLAGAAGNAQAFTSDEPTFTLAPSGGTLAGGDDGTLVAWSLLTLAEAKTALRTKGDFADAELVVLLRQITEMIEQEIGYRPVTGGDPITEVHDLANAQGFIYVRVRPVVSITSVTLRGSDDALESTSYRTNFKEGMISLGSGQVAPVFGTGLLRPAATPFNDWPEESWARQGGLFFRPGNDSATIVYVAGFSETSAVPGGLKAVAEEMLARRYRTRERKSQGVTSEIAQGFATATRYDPKVLTEDMKARLRPFKTLSQTARQ